MSTKLIDHFSANSVRQPRTSLESGCLNLRLNELNTHREAAPARRSRLATSMRKTGEETRQ